MTPEELGMLHMTSALRYQMLETLVDGDLSFALPGNPTLGELCREMGDVQRSYIDSFINSVQVWGLRSDDPGLASSVAAIQEWYRRLDEELDSVLAGIPTEDFQKRKIDRGEGFAPPVATQFHIYRESILIFCAKCSVYLKAMDKPFSEQWVHWIG